MMWYMHRFTSRNYRTFEVNEQVKGKIMDQKVVKKGIPITIRETRDIPYTCRLFNSQFIH